MAERDLGGHRVAGARALGTDMIYSGDCDSDGDSDGAGDSDGVGHRDDVRNRGGCDSGGGDNDGGGDVEVLEITLVATTKVVAMSQLEPQLPQA